MNSHLTKLSRAFVAGVLIACLAFGLLLKTVGGEPAIKLAEARGCVIWSEALMPVPQLRDQDMRYMAAISVIDRAPKEAHRRLNWIGLVSILSGVMSTAWCAIWLYGRPENSNQTYQSGARLVSSSEIKKLVRKGGNK